MENIPSSEITPEHLFISRRRFLLGAGALAAGVAVVAACNRAGLPPTTGEIDFCAGARASASSDELGAPITSCEDITNYNNFYEFSLDKDDVADLARNFSTSPWEIQVGGLVNKPRTYDMDDIRRRFPQEERVYRLRCVEAWSVVVPWVGFPLANLLREVEPTPQARFVRFQAVFDPVQMPGQKYPMFDTWPYIEGLRLDEAMHNLTILATGLYGKPLPPQEGAPIRVVVPWKYGFKSIKSIVKIDLVETAPVSFWMVNSPGEYGFYANVNPEVTHPRWSQSSERRLGELARRPTLLFNGYGDRVASLYAGMDLKKFF